MPKVVSNYPPIPDFKPVPGETTEEDIEAALSVAQMFLSEGGKWPDIQQYVDTWLDFSLTMKGKL